MQTLDQIAEQTQDKLQDLCSGYLQEKESTAIILAALQQARDIERERTPNTRTPTMPDLTQEQIKCVKQLFEEMCDAMEGGKGPSRMWVDPEDAEALAAVLAVVERLPRTKDGKIVVPNEDEVFSPKDIGGHEHAQRCGITHLAEWWQDDGGTWYVQDGWSFDVGGLDDYAHKVSDCYSTLDAARAAAEKGGA